MKKLILSLISIVVCSSSFALTSVQKPYPEPHAVLIYESCKGVKDCGIKHIDSKKKFNYRRSMLAQSRK
jgi:hypothetical protein